MAKPTLYGEPMVPVSLRITRGQHALLKQQAGIKGISVQQLMRALLRDGTRRLTAQLEREAAERGK